MSMTIREILADYPKGTLLKVWIKDSGMPGGLISYMGQFLVDRRTIRNQATGRTWGEARDEFISYNRYRPAIAKVKPVGR
ncbi:MAG: hypothetical protein M0Z41_10745 [Peptococcaceae bacterium]|nr:hypothetical protein [Peptococcaceae bacterium]